MGNIAGNTMRNVMKAGGFFRISWKKKQQFEALLGCFREFGSPPDSRDKR